jgi:hypothetical protein
MPGSALLLIRLALTAIAALAAWRFGFRGVLGLLIVVAALLLLLKGRTLRRNLD